MSHTVYHTIKLGDSLKSLAAYFYGDANQHGRIFLANQNRMKNPDNVMPGMRIVIPNTEMAPLE